MADRLDQLRAKLAQAEAARAVASDLLSEDDRAEITLRERIAKADAERLEAERTKRDLDLGRREDAAREAHGATARLSAIAIEGYADTFILLHSPRAFAAWEAGIQAAASNRKIDKAEVAREYAVAVVVDWNGITDFGLTSLHAHALKEFLKGQPGIVTAIVNEAVRLSGLFAEARKSGGQ